MMTRCNHIESMLTEYLSDELHNTEELGPLERAIVDEHLAECAACRIELAAAREIATGFASLPPASCPDELSRRILAGVDDELAGRTRTGRRQRPAFWRMTGLAGTVAAAVLLALVLPNRTPVSPDMATLPAADSTSIRVDQARQELLWTLAYTASVIDRSEKRSLADVWRQVRSRTPDSHTAAIPGGQG